MLWHPDDAIGSKITDWLIQHFHGPAYAGPARRRRRGIPAQQRVGRAKWATSPLPFVEALPADPPAGQITVVIGPAPSLV